LKAAPEGAQRMENDDVWTFNFQFKSAAHIEPFNKAMRQLEGLIKYMSGANMWMQEKESVLQTCRVFHPDWRFDPETRVLIKTVNHADLWQKWEEGVFDPKELEPHIRLSEVLLPNEMATWGAMHHRRQAVIATAQMAHWEGVRLLQEMAKPEPELMNVWQRLYWFTRFYRAFVSITEPITDTDFKHKMKGAELARAWKRNAWAYYLKVKKERPDLSASTIAQNYANATQTPQKKKDYQNYFGFRVNLFSSAKEKKPSDKG
jgi:hypothetical protein